MIDRVTPLAPDLPAPRLELLSYHMGTRWPIPPGTASNDIVATHSAVRVASLDATAAALARRGAPLAGDDLMILYGGIRATLVSGPDGHLFLVEEVAALRRLSPQATPGEQETRMMSRRALRLKELPYRTDGGISAGISHGRP